MIEKIERILQLSTQEQLKLQNVATNLSFASTGKKEEASIVQGA